MSKANRCVCVLVSVIPFVAASSVLLLRFGFGTDMGSLYRLCGISLLLINVPTIAGSRWYSSPASLTLLAISGLVISGWFAPSAVLLGTLFAFVGFLLWAANLIRWVRETKSTAVLIVLLLAGVLAGLYVAGQHWGSGYSHPLVEERMAAHLMHIDPFFQGSIATMLRVYHSTSTGLDGLPYVPYHFGSHIFVASMAELVGLRVIEFINMGIGIIVLPLFYATVLQFGVFLRGLVHPDWRDWLVPGGPLFWFVALLGLLSPFPKPQDMIRLSLIEVYVSDSYALGLAITFLAIYIAVDFGKQYLESTGDSAGEVAMLLCVLPVLLSLCGVTKVSLLYLLLGMDFFLCWRLKLLRRRLVMAHLIIATISALIVLKKCSGTGSANWSIFNFDRINFEWIPFFFIFYFWWVWCFLLLRTRQLKVKTLGDLIRSVRDNRTIAMECLVFCSVIGLIPYMLIEFSAGGSWNYFTQFQTFLGITFVIAYLPSWPTAFRNPFKLDSESISVPHLYGSIAILLLTAHLFTTSAGAILRLIKLNVTIRTALAGYPPEQWRNHVRKSYTSERGKTSDEARQIETTLSALKALSSLSRSERRVTALYIPKSNLMYWRQLRQQDLPVTPFIAPVFSQIAMIDGEPDQIPDYFRTGWGFDSYAIPRDPERNIPTAENAASRAASMGFHQLIVIGSDSSKPLSVSKIDLPRVERSGVGRPQH